MRDPSNKFRVYALIEKRFYDVNQLFITAKDGYAHIRDLLLEPEYFVIERCTGKADKNGNLMYAGDLVRCANGTVAPIVWDQDRCAFLIDTKPYKTEISGLEEIVGNIHEEVKDAGKAEIS